LPDIPALHTCSPLLNVPILTYANMHIERERLLMHSTRPIRYNRTVHKETGVS